MQVEGVLRYKCEVCTICHENITQLIRKKIKSGNGNKK